MEKEKVLLSATVVFLVDEFRKLVWLSKKTAKIGKGCWNGYGGGIKPGENLNVAALRELREESGVVTLKNFLWKVAEMDFYNIKTDRSVFVCKVHCFFVDWWIGDPQSKPDENMVDPTIFHFDNLPFDQMMPADKDFLPYVFAKRKVRGRAFLGPFQKEKLAPTEIEFVDYF